MTLAPSAQSEFARRYLLASFSTGAVVVDLISGNYFRVNRSAALICEALRDSANRAEAEFRIESQLGVPRDKARTVLAEVVAMLSGPALRGEIQGAYHFFPADGGYELRHADRRVLEVDGTDGSIRLGRDARDVTVEQLALYVRSVAPKLLFQRGVTVIHASACIVRGSLLAFAGLSGAGKTTTARAFRDAGARLISEDLVVVAPRSKRSRVFLNGEASIYGWARVLAKAIHANPSKFVPSETVVAAADGETAPLDEILILDRDQRSGWDYVTTPLEPPDALVALMTHDFLGAEEPEIWRRYFDEAVALLGVLSLKRASAPEGTERLVSAAARYTSTTTS